MKSSILIFAFLFVGLPSLYASSILTDAINDSGNPDLLKRDSMVGLSYKMVNNVVYFKLKMLNESKDGFYSMVREFSDGSFESVDVRQTNANTVNVPILYCFIDKKVPSVDFTYVLRRISNEITEVSRWDYCSVKKQVCPVEPLEDQLANQ